MSSPIPSQAAPRRSVPVWAIVLAGATVAGIGMGLRQIMGLYLKPITETLGIGREAFSIAIALANIVWGLRGAVHRRGLRQVRRGQGAAVRRRPAPRSALFLMVVATSELHLLISGVFMGLGVAGAGVTAMVGAIGRAAPAEKRTQAISMLGIGSGVGVLISLPYAHVLIEMFGWKASLVDHGRDRRADVAAGVRDRQRYCRGQARRRSLRP